MFTTNDEKTVTLKLQRRDVRRIVIALDVVTSVEASPEYEKIRKRIHEQLMKHDAKQKAGSQSQT